MIHAPEQIIGWLSTHCRHDRVLRNALAAGNITVDMEPWGWVVKIVSRHGIEYQVKVYADPVGMPCRWNRDEKAS